MRSPRRALCGCSTDCGSAYLSRLSTFPSSLLYRASSFLSSYSEKRGHYNASTNPCHDRDNLYVPPATRKQKFAPSPQANRTIACRWRPFLPFLQPWVTSQPRRIRLSNKPLLSDSYSLYSSRRPRHEITQWRRLHVASPSPPNKVPADDISSLFESPERREPIREHLKAWQQQYLKDNPHMTHELPGIGLVQRSIIAGVESMKGMEDLAPKEDDESDDLDDDFGDAEFHPELTTLDVYEAGDLVQINSGPNTNESIFAVFLRTRGYELELYTIRGAHLLVSHKRIKYRIPGIVSQQAVRSLLEYLPSPELDQSQPLMNWKFEPSVVPGGLGAPLLEIMNQFSDQCQEIYRQNAAKLDNAHQVLADESEDMFISLTDITVALLGKSQDQFTPPDLCVIHQCLQRRSSYFVSFSRGHIADTYLVRSKRTIRSMETVIAWVRQYQEASTKSASQGSSEKAIAARPLVQFVAKARRLIEKSRKIRSAMSTGSVGPSAQQFTPDQTEEGYVYQRIPGEVFSETDRMIINYMHHWVAAQTMMGQKHMMAAGAVILRAVGYYDKITLGIATGNLFLQEIGVYAPWENRALFFKRIDVPGHGGPAMLDELWHDAQRQAEQLAICAPVDSMEHLRRDWGDLEVFCVDSKNSKEIDDGISLEAVPGSIDRHWIHVHVANPTAFLAPDDPISRYAARAVTSFYLPERTYPLFPRELAGLCSLAPNRPVITFSALINGRGEVVEYKITHGIIRNVVYITPNQVAEIIEDLPIEARIDLKVSITVGRDLQPSSDGKRQIPPSFTNTQRQILQKLNEIRLSYIGNRLKHIPDARESTRLQNPDITVMTGRPIPPLNSADFSRAYHYIGDPTLRMSFDIPVGGVHYRGADGATEGSSPHFTTTFMILAGEVGARWCSDRGIPIAYRGNRRAEDASSTDGNDRLSAAESVVVETTFLTSVARNHDALGLEAYCRCTSPLRRYTDLLSHWQIDAAVRHENATSGSLVGTKDVSYLPFSHERIDRELGWIWIKEKINFDIHQLSLCHWIGQTMFRAFYFKNTGGTTLPDTFFVVIWAELPHYRSNPTGAKVQFKGAAVPWNFRVRVLEPEGGAAAEWGLNDLVETKIELVNGFSGMIYVRPLRLVKKAESTAYLEKMPSRSRWLRWVMEKILSENIPGNFQFLKELGYAKTSGC